MSLNSCLFLDVLDETLRAGLGAASDRFVEAQIGFVADRQQSDGGFRGRLGGSDLYYTDFALRCLALLAPDHPAFERVRSYLARQAEDVRTVVECFNVLNACRLLRAATDSRPTFEPPTERFDALLRGQLLPRGGMARSLGETRVSAYHTFLGSLCYQMLGQTMPVFDDAVRAIETLAHFDGGFAELEGQAAAQTNATSAAVAFLAMHNALTSERAAEARRFLSAMQGADGGLKAHADAATGDLLSTFTGFVAMASLGGLPQDAASGIAAFLRDVALFDGGFLACPGDDAADVEYTYYGLGVFSLLRRPSPFGEKTGY